MAFSQILAVETSCDDTSVAVVNRNGFVRKVYSAHQNKEHEAFGGIVPEIASRNHTHHLLPLIERCLSELKIDLGQLDGFAVTSKPGLIGSLMVGLVTVKSLALATAKPFIGVNHLEGHLLAPFLSDESYSPAKDFSYPYLALAVSGGHTSLYRIEALGNYQVLGQTIDDAAGEAFDKFGKILGLGFPGGVKVDHFSRFGVTTRFHFIRSMMNENHLNFSFSGMKAAARRTVEGLTASERAELQDDIQNAEPRPGILADLCAGFQEAVVDVLCDRLLRASDQHQLKRLVLTGGVSANLRLRTRALELAEASGAQLIVPPIRYCTDNAAMIGYAGIQRLNAGEFSEQSLGPAARAPLGLGPLPDNLPAWLVKAKS